MVHFENLPGIFQRRALLFKEKILQKKIPYRSIAYEDVQSLRDRIFVWDFSKGRYRRLHSYVPFYFATHTPMLYVQYSRGIQKEIVIFEVNRSILKDEGVLFTDGNASNQQLSQSWGERVGIIPATLSNNLCRRKYDSGGPYGTNSRRSDFYSNAVFLERLQWDVINDRWFNEEEKRRIKHAEVLVPDILPLGRVQGIYISSRNMVQAVNAVIEDAGLSGRIPSAVWKPSLYF